MPVDHFTVTVPQAKLDDVVKFLTASLQHIGFKEKMRPVPSFVGLGAEKPWFFITSVEGDAGTLESVMKKQHIAFTATSAEQVDQFHAAALKAGGTDNGAPGPRPQYHPGYYAAFVRDSACGVNFEMCCHTAV